MFRSDAFSRLQRSAMAWIGLDALSLMSVVGGSGTAMGPEAIVLLLFFPFVAIFMAMIVAEVLCISSSASLPGDGDFCDCSGLVVWPHWTILGPVAK